MKKVLTIVALIIATTANAGRPNLVNEKVQKAFNETFINATEVSWKELANTFVASFVERPNVKTVAVYDREGKLESTTRYYSEAMLPPFMVTRLKEKYAGRTIAGVTEKTTEEGVTFIINMEDSKRWYKVQSDILGNAEVMERFNKE